MVRHVLVSAVSAAVAISWPTRGSELALVPRAVAVDQRASGDAERVLDDMSDRLSPRRLRLPRSRVTPAVARAAAAMLDAPWGSEEVRTIDAVRYVLCIEPHYHSPESGKTPVGWHKGVTVYLVDE